MRRLLTHPLGAALHMLALAFWNRKQARAMWCLAAASNPDRVAGYDTALIIATIALFAIAGVIALVTQSLAGCAVAAVFAFLGLVLHAAHCRLTED